MEIVGEENITKKRKETLSVDYLANLIFFSFKFSQGNPILQNEIFKYIRLIHPDLVLPKSPDLISKVGELIKQYLERAHGKGLHESNSSQNPKTVEGQIKEEVNDFLSASGDYEKDQVLENLAYSILSEDFFYLSKSRGRPREELKTGEESTPATDSYLSQICWYGFLGHTTGIAEYDQMFREITDFIKNGGLNSSGEKLRTVIEVYNRKHPNQQVEFVVSD